MAESSGLYGSFTFLPISFGFVVGALFVYMADLLLPLVVCLIYGVCVCVGGGGGGGGGGRVHGYRVYVAGIVNPLPYLQ